MPPELNQENPFESTAGIDPVEFGSSLFNEPASPSEDKETVSPPAPVVSPDAGSPTPEAWEALPKSWKKEMEAHWKSSPAEVRQYAHERERQVTEGISGYSARAQKWDKVSQPFAQLMQEYPDADPTVILQSLAENHIQMVRASPAEKAQHAMNLARAYGVELTPKEARQMAAGETPQSDDFTPGQLARLRQEFGPSMEAAQIASSHVQRQVAEAATAEVDRFFSDKQNEFVNDVADDILSIMKKGQASSLPEAYELAVLKNPAVKARYIAGLAAKVAPPVSSATKLPNVKSSATPPSPAPKGSIDDTINSVIAKHYS